MLLGGDSVAVMPKLMMVGDLLRGALQLAPLPIAAPERPAGLIRRRAGPLSPAAAFFVDVCAPMCANSPSAASLDITLSYSRAANSR